jgi:hypothetical protein
MKKTAMAIMVVAAGVNLSAQKAGWTASRTIDGQPDLQGTWANNTVTPLERPAELVGRPTLTDAEVATLKARSARLFDGEGDAAFGDQLFATLLTNPDTFTSSDGKTGDYNQFWLPDRVFENRTSLVTDPADGRIPPMLPAAQRRLAVAAAARPTLPRGPEDRAHRCTSMDATKAISGSTASLPAPAQRRETTIELTSRAASGSIVWFFFRGRPPCCCASMIHV